MHHNNRSSNLIKKYLKEIPKRCKFPAEVDCLSRIFLKVIKHVMFESFCVHLQPVGKKLNKYSSQMQKVERSSFVKIT